MNAPIRVLLVDDSSLVRKLLTAALSAHPEIEVVGSAANGLIALNKLPLLTPDAVILDVEMPEMDGITALTRIRATHPRLPVIMFSTLTERGANVTFDALAAGASDYVLKPSTQLGETIDQVVAKSLVPKLIALTRSRFGLAMQAALATLGIDGSDLRPLPLKSDPIVGAQSLKTALSVPASKRMSVPDLSALGARASLPARASVSLRAAAAGFAGGRSALPFGRKSIQVIAIATSTGGPNALAEVVPRLPALIPVPIVIVQHMPAIFTRCLAERLASRSELKVIESVGNELLRAGTVYIAPGNRHLEVQRSEAGMITVLNDGAPENSCRPSADVLFRSLARAYGGGVLAVVLTGMGQDGARGAREIHEAGGRIIAQSGPSCVVWGMPKAVEEAGIAESVVPLSEMASAILQHVGHGLLTPLTLGEP